MHTFFMKTAASFVLCVTLSRASISLGQSNEPQLNQILQIGVGTTTRSQTIHVEPGFQISVTGHTEDPTFAVDLYIYKKDEQNNEVLMAKDDDEANSAEFAWQPSLAGNYYVLARNLSPGAGSISISVNHVKALPSSNYGSAGEAPLARIKIFYATDRNVVKGGDGGEEYGTEVDPQGRMHLGECTVSIPRDHRMGELEGPSITRLQFSADPSKHIVLQRADPEDRLTFFRNMAARSNHSQKKEVFVFVHGFDNTFADAAMRTAQMSYDLAFDGPAVFYSWPSKGKIGPLSYNEDLRNANLTAANLRTFLTELASQSGAATIHLMAHSMGNLVLANALSNFLQSANIQQKPMFEQVMMVAPDIDAALFKQLSQQLRPAAHRITLYASSRDKALEAAHLYAGYTRAGQGGANILVLPGIDTVDASAVDTSMIGFFHQYYADNTQVLSDLFHVIRGDPIASRFGLQRDTFPGGTYWEFRPAIH